MSLAAGCTKDKVYKIGVSQCSQDDWRKKMNDEIDREIISHEDAVVEVRSADDSSEKQIEDIRYFADNRFDIIIVSPNEAARLTPVIKEIHDRGIPVMIFDRNINGDSYTARIGVDDEGIGQAAAHYAIHLLGDDAKAIEIFGLPGSTPAEDRQPENCAKKSQCPFNGLNLTDAQKNKLKELHKAEAAKRQECKQAKQGCSRTMRTEHLAAVKAILTPEQYVSYLENIAVSGHGSWKKPGKHHRAMRATCPAASNAACPQAPASK